jgi:hypothetical protein
MVLLAKASDIRGFFYPAELGVRYGSKNLPKPRPMTNTDKKRHPDTICLAA